MPLPPSIADRAQALRAEGVEAPLSVDAASSDCVQLAVRMPAALRDGIHAAARRGGASTQAWVNQVLSAAVVEASDPQLRLAGHLLDELRHELDLVVRSGAYERFTRALDDADLAEG